jgi:hypothetical protein
MLMFFARVNAVWNETAPTIASNDAEAKTDQVSFCLLHPKMV